MSYLPIDLQAMEEEASTESQLIKNVSPLELKYTDVEKLSMVVTGTGKILARKFTGLTAHQQRHVTRMIKRARNMLLMK
ncbi:MAG: 30S ribosomal protein S18 [Puniceicoccales bacterium]|jgi:small subunit ribosomal protein S18|nr:30S ribosomal protein S18 [Puniceicoccales bacterium]